MAYPDRPPWVILHVPHDSTDIPVDVRDQFVLDDAQLDREVLAMTDHLTYQLFGADACPGFAVRAPVSRLVVDVERFEDDAVEPMARRGMGVVYNQGSQGQRLRRDLAPLEREELLARYFHPHHARLDASVASSLEEYGRCLVLDCHSFPAAALPYEQAASHRDRPDICIGTDESHTPERLARAFVSVFEEAGWLVAVNHPFAGALVPARYYRRDLRVCGVMVEVNRRLYLEEADGSPSPDFATVRQRIISCCARAIAQGVWGAES